MVLAWILGESWVDLWWILSGSWVDLGWILSRSWVDLGWTLGWPMVGQWLAECWAMVGQWLANGGPMAGQWLANGWPMVGQWLANGWLMVDNTATDAIPAPQGNARASPARELRQAIGMTARASSMHESSTINRRELYAVPAMVFQQRFTTKRCSKNVFQKLCSKNGFPITVFRT